jgi:hypothetical protein
MGAPSEVIDKLKSQDKESVEVFDVFPENWDAFLAFTRLSTQWIVVQGVYVGFNYQSLEFLLKLYSVKDRRQVFEDVQIMESSALAVLNKKG